MTLSDICTKDVVSIDKNKTALDAAKLMQKFNVGTLVVVDKGVNGDKPVGIITDRDLLLKILADESRYAVTKVAQIMSDDLLKAEETDDIYETLRRMRFRGVRRLPVVNEEGYLAGILTIDDILEFFTKEMSEVIRLFQKEKPTETRTDVSV